MTLIGQHLLFQGVASAMPTRGQAAQFLVNLAKLLDVSIVCGPHVHTSDSSVLAFMIIAESHLSIHLHAAPGASFIDVFSCKPFDTVAIVSYIKKWLDFQRVAWRELNRGVAA